MRAYKDKEYTLHYAKLSFESVKTAIKNSSDDSADIPRFLQRLWELGYKIEPVKISNKRFEFEDSIAVFQTMLHKNIPDYQKTKIWDILRDCNEIG